MRTQHTAGQWIKGSKSFKRITSNGKLIATVAEVRENGYRTVSAMQEEAANTNLIAAAPELLQMVYDLKNCIKRLTQDNLTQFDRDTEAQWEGEAHELLSRINPNYYKNANE